MQGDDKTQKVHQVEWSANDAPPPITLSPQDTVNQGTDHLAVGINRQPRLHLAAQKGKAKLVKVWARLVKFPCLTLLPNTQDLLDRGADVDVTDRHGCTALHKAASHGHVEVVKVRQCNIRSLEEDSSTQILLDRGADIEAMDEGGRTALHEAALRGEVGVVKVRRRDNCHLVKMAACVDPP